jgi:hypothetical protein
MDDPIYGATDVTKKEWNSYLHVELFHMIKMAEMDEVHAPDNRYHHVLYHCQSPSPFSVSERHIE